MDNPLQVNAAGLAKLIGRRFSPKINDHRIVEEFNNLVADVDQRQIRSDYRQFPAVSPVTEKPHKHPFCMGSSGKYPVVVHHQVFDLGVFAKKLSIPPVESPETISYQRFGSDPDHIPTFALFVKRRLHHPQQARLADSGRSVEIQKILHAKPRISIDASLFLEEKIEPKKATIYTYLQFDEMNS